MRMDLVFRFFKKRKAANKMLVAADKMTQLLQSLPWFNNSEGTIVSLDNDVWKQ